MSEDYADDMDEKRRHIGVTGAGDAKQAYAGECPLDSIAMSFAAKWKPAILYLLHQHAAVRFNEFRRLVPGITQRMLTRQLKELQRDGLIQRTDYNESPPRVEYALTPLGASLGPILQSIADWEKQNHPQIALARAAYDQSDV